MKIQWLLIKSVIGMIKVARILANPTIVELREATIIGMVAGITTISRSH
jgi:hypothetical protein